MDVTKRSLSTSRCEAEHAQNIYFMVLHVLKHCGMMYGGNKQFQHLSLVTVFIVDAANSFQHQAEVTKECTNTASGRCSGSALDPPEDPRRHHAEVVTAIVRATYQESA